MTQERPEQLSDIQDVGERLTRIISLLVDTPSEVRVAARRDRATTVFEVRVEPDDLGQLIGRQGRTARSLRALLDVRGTRDGRRYGLDIREF